jgi:hypothetical protein
MSQLTITEPNSKILRAFHVSRCQAKFRKEAWDLSYDEYCKMWRFMFHLRGMTVNDYAMSRKDPSKPWDVYNTVIMTRGEIYAMRREQQ